MSDKAEKGTVRVVVGVTPAAKAQLEEWAKRAGVRTNHFLSMALMLGARELSKKPGGTRGRGWKEER